jgi:hypothetical protein
MMVVTVVPVSSGSMRTTWKMMDKQKRPNLLIFALQYVWWYVHGIESVRVGNMAVESHVFFRRVQIVTQEQLNHGHQIGGL